MFDLSHNRSEPRRDDLPQALYHAIYGLVPRLTAELLIISETGVLLTKRQFGPCKGLWHLPGGTVRYGERLTDAAVRIGSTELGCVLATFPPIGIIEYPSHLAAGIDWPVGVVVPSQTMAAITLESAQWFEQLPDDIHEEQRVFLESVDRSGLPRSVDHLREH
jgi:ADP-ribose pyrophosphatase YjhB (NUDIX family)